MKSEDVAARWIFGVVNLIACVSQDHWPEAGFLNQHSKRLMTEHSSCTRGTPGSGVCCCRPNMQPALSPAVSWEHADPTVPSYTVWIKSFTV
jgi:hypothetical protein